MQFSSLYIHKTYWGYYLDIIHGSFVLTMCISSYLTRLSSRLKYTTTNIINSLLLYKIPGHYVNQSSTLIIPHTTSLYTQQNNPNSKKKPRGFISWRESPFLKRSLQGTFSTANLARCTSCPSTKLLMGRLTSPCWIIIQREDGSHSLWHTSLVVVFTM